ncbi:DASS family sodium-coupled anion symporter [Halomicroarcula sp. F13]|uniref:DASS family sodium-coupled anion symporter n=1 Tax=Haloarcula rubra TaxID=2487747 RepID=A0AAW4PTJ8_9EURY|nr:DASS family sodium-coupled anion symporter [Halomicroarcula rubra]MBX0324611.1 DASS family sodium-coupled anion symporter [Halomicroarcula rubra]
MTWNGHARPRRLVVALVTAGVVTALVATAPTPTGLDPAAQYALATMALAAILWVTKALPLPVTALLIPVALTTFGIYDSMERALSGFADPLIFLFIAGFMLAKALQTHNIDRRLALTLINRMGRSPRLLILAIMLATAFMSMWVSNTATTAMMTPVALGVLAQVVGRESPEGEVSNMRVATLLGTAYAASVGGVGTLIGTPPNVVAVAFLDRLVGVEISFAQWLAVGLPIVAVTLPLTWYVLTFWLYPPEIDSVQGAQEQAATYLEEEGDLSPRGRRAAVIFAVTAGLWILGGLGFLFEGVLPDPWFVTLFGGEGESVFGLTGHRGILYFVVVGLLAIPALVLSDADDWENLVDIDWGTIVLFGGGISLADALAETEATNWLARSVFDAVVGAPLVLVVLAVVVFTVLVTELSSNTATTTILAPILIGLGSVLAGTLGVDPVPAAVFLTVTGAIAASFAFALPVATPPNAIVFGSGHLEQRDMIRAGVVLNVLMTIVLTMLLVVFFSVLWPNVLW